MRMLVLAAAIAAMAGCSNSDQASSADAQAAANQAAMAAEAAANNGWVYFATRDQMTDEVSRYAQVQSLDYIPATGPYPSVPLILMFVPPNDVWLSLPKGQYNCAPDYCTIQVRFDGAAPVRFDVSEIGRDSGMERKLIELRDPLPPVPSDMRDRDYFVQHFGKARDVLVQVPVHGLGYTVVKFDLSGFDRAALDATQP